MKQLQTTMDVPSKQHVDPSGLLSNNFSLLNVEGTGSGRLCSYQPQALMCHDRHMTELGIHHRDSAYSKRHFAMAILEVEHQ